MTAHIAGAELTQRGLASQLPGRRSIEIELTDEGQVMAASLKDSQAGNPLAALIGWCRARGRRGARTAGRMSAGSGS
jgi:hypothetical protein